MQIVCYSLCSVTCSLFSTGLSTPTKVHVWAGISMRDETEIFVFDRTMDSPLYIEILERTLIPFLQKVYPDRHQFIQDNGLEHTSKAA